MMNEKKLKKILSGLESLTKQEKKDLLKDLRNDIDLMDRNIAAQLSERFKLVLMIGKVKQSLGIQTYSSKREKEILKNITATTDVSLLQESIKKIYTKIIEQSRLLQKSAIDSSFFLNDKNKVGSKH